MQTGDKNDYSVCTTWRVDKNDVYLLDVFRGRLEFPDLRRKLLALAEQYKPSAVLIEDLGPGMSLLQDVRNSILPGMIRPIGIKPAGDKVERMAAQSARFEAGQVHILNNAPWRAEFLAELLAFPNGRHDDQVDSVNAVPYLVAEYMAAHAYTNRRTDSLHAVAKPSGVTENIAAPSVGRLRLHSRRRS